jgi:hypothetical protein
VFLQLGQTYSQTEDRRVGCPVNVPISSRVFLLRFAFDLTAPYQNCGAAPWTAADALVGRSCCPMP